MRYILSILTIIIACNLSGQDQRISTAFEKEIESYINHTVKTISVDSLDEKLNDVILLDAREKEEYDISKIPGAIYIGYKNFNKVNLKNLDKNKEVVVYCSIGYRSEKIGEILKKEGFRDVQNLYGSIFAWANAGYPLEDKDGNPTINIHTYNKKWSRWVVNKNLEKIW